MQSGRRGLPPQKGAGRGVIWVSRNRRGHEAHLDWRIRLFFSGAVLAMAGMAMDQSWLIGLAIGVLVVAILLRFIPGLRNREAVDPAGDPGDGEGEE